MGIGDIISGIFGSKNKYEAPAQGAYQVNSNAYNYGGNPNGAADAAGYYNSMGANAMNRAAPQANFQYAQPDYQYAAGHAAMGSADRTAQGQTANLMYQRATGATPSIAGQQAAVDRAALGRQTQEQNRQAMAGQASMAASARGPAALALAQQNAANNVANAQGQIGTSAANAAQGISDQAQVNAANERMQAEQGAMGAFTGMRQGDQAAQDAAVQQAQFGAQLATGQQQFNTSAQLQNRAQNDDQTGLGFSQLGNQVQTAQLGASQNEQAQRSANANAAMGVNAGVAGQNANMNQTNAMGLVGAAVTGTAGAAIPKAEGGMVRAGEPLVVGDAPGNPYRAGGAELFLPAGRHPGINPTGPQRPPPALLAPPAAMAPGARTWGVGPGTTQEQIATMEAGIRADRARQMQSFAAHGDNPAGPQAYASPIAVQRARDEETLMGAGARRAEGLESTPKEEQAAKSARYRLKQDAKIEGAAEAEKAEPAAKPAPPGLASAVGNFGKSLQDQAAKIDTAYHGPEQGYIPPTLIAPRAAGGPVDSGNAYLVGEQGPEIITAPSDGFVIPAPQTSKLLGGINLGGVAAGSGSSEGSAADFSGGGGIRGVSPIGQYKQASNFAASFAHGNGNQAQYGREDGGPIGEGDRVKVGEKGTELVVEPSRREMKTFQRGNPEMEGWAIRDEKAAGPKSDDAAVLRDAVTPGSPLQMLALPDYLSRQVLRGMADADRKYAAGAVRTPAQIEADYVQQGKPQGDKRVAGVIGASSPEEPLPPGVAPAVHPLPAPPAMAVAAEPQYRWVGDRLVLDDSRVAPSGPSPLPLPKAPPIQAPAQAKPPVKASIADVLAAMKADQKFSTGSTHRTPARKRQ